jgi:hypothetical protein
VAEMISPPGPDQPEAQIAHWPDGGGIAVITWRDAEGQVYRQEVPNEREAAELLAKIGSDDRLDLVSAQLRRAGIGPDS